MIPRIKVGRGVTGAVRYIMGEGRDALTGDLKTLAEGESTRVAWIGGTGFGFDICSEQDAELARRIMEFDSLNQSSRTRQCEKDCVHLSLAWRPGEEPTREQMEKAACGALKAIGMENCKALFAAHTDEGYSHIHIVASKIDPDTGRAYDLKGNYLKLSEWAEAYERDNGGVVCLRRESANELRAAIAGRDAGAVLDQLTRQRATFTEANLERALGKQIKNEPERTQFAGEILGHAEAVRLTDQVDGPVTRFTTRAVMESEQQVLSAARAIAARNAHGMMDHHRAAALDRFATIRDDQRAAFEHATGTAGLVLIDGQAGTGKSFTISAVRTAYEEAGCRVIGLAPTNAVAQDMAADGFQKAATVHSELFALNNQRTYWDRRTVVIVDEAAMIDTKHMAALTAHARDAGAKLILVGDDRQLSSIERGGMFGTLKDQHGAAPLTEVTRQYKQDDRRAAAMMAEGNFSDAVAIYEKKGAITWTRTQEEARGRLVDRWTADTEAAPDKSRFVFAYTNTDVDALNHDLRQVQQRRGLLGEGHTFDTAHGPREFAAGDRLQFTATDKKQGIFNGMAGNVVAIEDSRITVQLDGKQPKQITFNAQEFNGFRHGYAGTIYKGQGRTLDQTYLYHSEHWRSAASYVALTRHREKTELFVARNTAADEKQLARQMARVDDRRAASSFHTVKARLEPHVAQDRQPVQTVKETAVDMRRFLTDPDYRRELREKRQQEQRVSEQNTQPGREIIRDRDRR